jgi:S-formylglutathione hydrolase FrmB
MKKIIFIIGLIAAVMIFWGCEDEVIDLNVQKENQLSQKNDFIDYKSKLQNKEFTSESLMNNVIGNNPVRKMQVYTPPGYDHKREQGYPVVYLLHGFPFTEKSFIDIHTWDEWINPAGIFTVYPDFPEDGFRNWVDNLIETGEIEPMIIVMPNAMSSYGFSFYSNSILNGDFEDYIVYDLVNFMDKRYNTIANNEGRAVIGHSQGGYAAFKFGMLHPEIFGTVASHSGLLLVDALFDPGFIYLLEQENQGGFTGPDPTKFLTSAMYAMSAAWSPNLGNPPFYVDLPLEFQADGHLYPVPTVIDLWHQNDVFSLLNTYHDTFNSLNGIYLDVGIYDELGTQLAHVPVIAKLDFFGIDYTFETYEGGHHSNMFERLAISLQFCSNALNQ